MDNISRSIFFLVKRGRKKKHGQRAKKLTSVSITEKIDVVPDMTLKYEHVLHIIHWVSMKWIPKYLNVDQHRLKVTTSK
jgi:hypothetical protein